MFEIRFVASRVSQSGQSGECCCACPSAVLGREGGGVSRWVVIENRLALALLLRFVGLLLIVIVFGMFMTFALNFLAGML